MSDPAKIKLARKTRGETQAQFAAWLGVKTRTVVAWENDQNPVPAWVWRRLAESREVSPSLPVELVLRAANAAAAQGISLDEWLADAMRAQLENASLSSGQLPPSAITAPKSAAIRSKKAAVA